MAFTRRKKEPEPAAAPHGWPESAAEPVAEPVSVPAAPEPPSPAAVVLEIPNSLDKVEEMAASLDQQIAEMDAQIIAAHTEGEHDKGNALRSKRRYLAYHRYALGTQKNILKR